ncbi:MAG: hypothetical protein HW374_1331 [Bacteroidetes bacterium]|nr:hypothetical protein [Bacteroidota bacterium]
MTSDEYGKVIETHARPYVVEFHGSTGAILLFGAEHTKDPANPQIQQIRESWKTFKPTVALVEGRMGFLFRWFMDPIREFGESGLVLDLAKDSGIDFYTWEPSFEKEIEFQLQRFPAKRVALFYVIRPYASNYRHGKPDDLDEFLEEYRSKRTKYPGLEGTLPSIGTIDSMWRTDFPESKDWRDLSDMYGYPGYLQEIFVESNSFRDEHFARSILDLVNKGQRVFAVCGSSHAVKLDSTLRVEVAKGK